MTDKYTEIQRSSFNRAYLALLTGIFATSMAAIFIRLAQEENVPSLLIAGGRLIIATLVLTPVVFRNKSYTEQIRRLSRRELTLIIVSGLFLALHFASWVTALEYTTVLISGVLVSTTPIWVALLEVFVLKARLSSSLIVGLIIVLIGGAIISLSGGGEMETVKDNQPMFGAFLSSVGAIAIAVYFVIGRKLRSNLSLTPYIWTVYGVAAITLSIAVLLTKTEVAGYSVDGYVWIMAVALVPQLIGHSSYNFALAYLPATYISLATQTEPLLSAIAAYFVFIEIPGELQIVGGIVIIVGVVWAALDKPKMILNSLIIEKNRPLIRKVGDSFVLFLLILYILAGTSEVPFHGDESTTIWMTRDYYFVFIEGNVQQVRYNEPPLHQTGQHMRLITSSLTKYLMGFAWHISGYSIGDINEQWDWSRDWEYNQNNNHAPDDTLLMLGRLPSALMLATGAIVMFLIGMKLRREPVAYIASIYYALNPALLLNGRRAMFEGGLILFSLLTVLAAIWLMQNRRWRYAIILAVASGLAVSAKHTAIFTLIPVFAACFVHSIFWIKDRKEKLTLSTQLTFAGLLAFTIFYLLNPIWWGDPIQRTGQVYEARKGILDGQVAFFGGYDDLTDQLSGFARQTFTAKPQYYEVSVWEDYIGDQINDYELTIWRGISFGETIPGTIIMGLLSCAGFWFLWRNKKTLITTKLIIGVWSAVILIESALLTPLEWQRYYLMTYPVVGLLSSLGFVWLILYVRESLTRFNHAP